MSSVSFEWDERKNKLNQKKHGVSFEEAKSVFFDENAIEFYDNHHSNEEDRFLMLGFSSQLRLLIVCHCFRKSDSTIRNFSARRATKNEAKFYGGDL